MALTPSQTRFLRGRAHDLKPVIMVGAKGASDAVLAELETALEHHELVKVKLAVEDRDARAELGTGLAARTKAEVVQRIGKTLCLYRRSREKPRLVLPK